MIFTLMAVWKSKIPQQALPWIKHKLTPKKDKNSTENSSHSPNLLPPLTVNHINGETYSRYESHSSHRTKDEDEERDDYVLSSPVSTPLRNRSYSSRSRSRTPLSLNGTYRAACSARTRMGTPCKLSSLPGRDYCFKHQTGDSIFAG